MRKLILLLIFYNLSLQAQKINPKTISLSENPTNSELQFLKEELKNKQVVLLGENTHFDGNVIEFRNKIISFLFKELGFTTIAFESGIYDVYKAQEEIKTGENINFAFQNSLMGAWGFFKEPMQVLELYKKYKPQVFGFDNQFTNSYGFNFFHKDLYDYLKKNRLSFPFNKDDFELLLESLNQSGTFDEADIPFVKFENYFKKLLLQIQKLPKNKENIFWFQIIESFLMNTKDIYTTKDFWTPFAISTNDNIRDKQMAKNLLEYVRNHPKEKIVCWGANLHFVSDMSGVTDKKLQNVKPMGTYLKEELGDKLYSLASVTAVKNYSYNGKTYKIPIDSLSFEYEMLKKDNSVTFIRAKQKTLEKPIKNRLFANDKFMYANMNTLFDGYLFFRDFKPSTPIKEFKSNKSKEKLTRTIEGKVIDAKTRKPLEMAEVIIPELLKSCFTDKQGDFRIEVSKEDKIEKFQVNYLGYESKEVVIGNHNLIKLKEAENMLDEVIIKSDRQAIRTLKNVLKSIDKNYQTTPLNYKRYTVADYKVKDSSYLKFKIITGDYDIGFLGKYRPAHQVEQVKWIHKNNKKHPKNVRELMQPYDFFQAFFNKRKLKKFSLQFKNDTLINGRKTTIISFSTPRQQYIYTLKFYKCKYNGKVYIDDEDKAIIRFEENFNVTEFTPDDFMFGWYLPFDTAVEKSKIVAETKIVNYQKHKNQKYYVADIDFESKGKFFNKEAKEFVNTSRKVQQIFFEYDYKGSNVIKHKKLNNNSFKGVKCDDDFWKKFKLKK